MAGNVHVVENRNARRTDVHTGELGLEAAGDRRHERAVDRDAHRQANGTPRARVARPLDGQVDCTRRPRDRDLPRCVEVDRGDVAELRSIPDPRANLDDFIVAETDDSSDPALAFGNRFLHEPAPDAVPCGLPR